MEEFKNKTEGIYLDSKYFDIEEEYVKSDNIYNEDDYYDYSKLRFMDNSRIKEVDIKISSEFDVNLYIDNFICDFLKVFPNIYIKDELKKILKENVKSINSFDYFINDIVDYDDLNYKDGKAIEVANLHNNIGGEYLYNTRQINIANINNKNSLFHEFIHGLRGNEEILSFPIPSGIIESFTAYAERIYKVCSNNNFEKNYLDVKFCYYKDRKTRIKYCNGYTTLSTIAQELELLYELLDKNDTILFTFLRRENIYAKIKEIYDKYYSIITKNKNYSYRELEYFSMKSAYQLIIDIDEIHKLIIDDTTAINELLLAILEVESEIKELLLVINIDKDTNYNSNFNRLSITQYIENYEDRLLKVLFNKKAEDLQILRELFGDDYNNNSKKYTLKNRITRFNEEG